MARETSPPNSPIADWPRETTFPSKTLRGERKRHGGAEGLKPWFARRSEDGNDPQAQAQMSLAAMTRRALFAALAGAPFMPASIARWIRARQGRDSRRELRAYGEAQARKLGMNSEEDVERVVHEYREEEQAKNQDSFAELT